MNPIFQNILIVTVLLLIGGMVLLFQKLFEIQKKVSLLYGGKDSQTEGEFLKDVVRRVMKLEAKTEEFEPRIKILESIGTMSVQKVGFLRFNPFSDTGGDNSFVLVLLDRENNGVLVSTLYTREGVRIYGKAIEAGKSRHPLSDEEKKALEDALKK